jgi:hypothetical protein
VAQLLQFRLRCLLAEVVRQRASLGEHYSLRFLHWQRLFNRALGRKWDERAGLQSLVRPWLGSHALLHAWVLIVQMARDDHRILVRIVKQLGVQ